MEQKDKNIKYNEKKKEREIIKSMRGRGKIIEGEKILTRRVIKVFRLKRVIQCPTEKKKLCIPRHMMKFPNPKDKKLILKASIDQKKDLSKLSDFSSAKLEAGMDEAMFHSSEKG